MAVGWQDCRHFIRWIFLDVFRIENPQFLRILQIYWYTILAFFFWIRHMLLPSFKLCSSMYTHYFWQIVQLSISQARLLSPSQTLEHPLRRRSDRKECSVTFHVPMTAEARNLPQKEPKENILK